MFKTACIQLTSTPQIEDNLAQAEKFIRQAAAQGAQFVATPEVTDRILPKIPANIGRAFREEDHPGVPFFAALAKDLRIWLLIGSMSIKVAEDKIANRSYLFAPDGSTAATYNKLHLFDVDLPTGEIHRESNVVQPGNKAVVADMDGVKLGMSICYDLRFSYLYRDLAKAGAHIISVPSAFTVPTGRAHWEILLRARAIETGSFIIAPAQTGVHFDNTEYGRRETWGHSMIISPWGEILAEAGREPGVIMADLNIDEVTKIRTAIPALKHDRKYSV